MAKQYDIFSVEDFTKMVDQFLVYFAQREKQKLPFQKIKIISKKWQQSKSSAQHKKYWSCITELKTALNEAGYILNDEECHQFIKQRAGFTKVIDGTMITKSIADKSEEATKENLSFLIEYIIRFCQEELNYTIDPDIT